MTLIVVKSTACGVTGGEGSNPFLSATFYYKTMGYGVFYVITHCFYAYVLQCGGVISSVSSLLIRPILCSLPLEHRSI